MNRKPIRLTHCFTLFSILSLTQAVGAAVVMIDEDFSSLPLDVTLEDRSTWWGPSWNSGDIAYTVASLTGPGGVPAVTKTTEVFAGRFYGGGLRDGLKEMPDFGVADVAPGDVRVSFWIKGTSTQERGQIGFSLLSLDSSSGSAEVTGAAYYRVPIAPAEWTEISLTMDQMEAGIPGHSTAGKAFDFSSDQFQVFIWTRNEFETGWPIQENEQHVWSFSVAALSVVAEVEGGATWAGYPIVDGWADASDLLGWVYVGSAPWAYSLGLGRYIYLPEQSVQAGGAWVYVPR